MALVRKSRTPEIERLPAQHRACAIDSVRAEVEGEDAPVRRLELSFSSEDPEERWWGIEILGHDPGEIRADWINSGAAPLLNQHRPDQQIGVVEGVRFEGGRGLATVRFGSSAIANEVWRDIEDGIIRNVSVGYRIYRLRLEEENDDMGTYRAIDWEPHEISIVSVPADKTIGIGRAEGAEEFDLVIVENRGEAVPETEERNVVMSDVTEAARAQDQGQAEAAAKKARAEERERIANITKMQTAHSLPEDMVQAAIREGTPAADFAAEALDFVGKRGGPVKVRRAEESTLGMTEKEVKRYSFMRAVRALAPNASRRDREEAAFEIEVSEAAAQRTGSEVKGILVPHDVLAANIGGDLYKRMASRLKLDMTRAPQSVSTANLGGNLVATDLLAASFIDLLREMEVLSMLGGTYLTGLNGDISIPKQTGGASAFWVATEGADAQETNVNFGNVALTPKTLGAFTDITRKLLLQSSIDIEAMVRADLLRALSLEISRAALYGTNASGQPRGLVNQTGINKVTFGAADPTNGEVIDLETEVAADDADLGSLGYAFNARMRGHFKQTVKYAGTGMTIWEPGNTVNGYMAAVSNQVVAGDVWFGNWSDLVIGMWGGLDITVNPYSNAKSGTLQIVVHQSMDVAIRNAESFCLGNDTP